MIAGTPTALDHRVSQAVFGRPHGALQFVSAIYFDAETGSWKLHAQTSAREGDAFDSFAIENLMSQYTVIK